ncbi:hypothetical protein GF354_02780 [Candidatus Peregrinibacteria bacterium]|nr:hypothetical protein [Candidatus Peregrinibacteria bacterium]
MENYIEKLKEFLLSGEFITREKLNELENISATQNIPLTEVLIEYQILKDSQLGQLISDICNWQYADLNKEEIDENILKLIPAAVAKKQKVIAFQENEQGIKVAMESPDNVPIIHLIEKKIGKKVIPYYSTKKQITDQFVHYENDLSEDFVKLIETYKKEGESDSLENSAVVKMVNLLLKKAFEQNTSDIHFEPMENKSLVRFRIDGVLHDVIEVPKEFHDLIVTRIKILSNLRTDEHQVPQDGKLEFTNPSGRIDIRVSILPTTKGENIVMRLLADKDRHYTLEDLGLSEKDYAKLKNNTLKPWGMMLVTGPTGSGKTTTLYSILKILNRREVNISTIEDPVEYNISGITQIQVNPKAKLTFASGLRSIVRQDPDIIMVGEIRDEETADIAVNSAMTGHLVLSTLHTNDAPTSLPRLLEMGIDPFLVTSTVNVIIAQRLLRKICMHCIQSKKTLKSEVENKLPKHLIEKIFKDKDEALLYSGKGCKICKDTGYDGRIGVFEILELTEDIRALIISKASSEKIKKEAIKNGMTTMLDDAMEKALNGVTTIEEIIRVVRN